MIITLNLVGATWESDSLHGRIELCDETMHELAPFTREHRKCRLHVSTKEKKGWQRVELRFEPGRGDWEWSLDGNFEFAGFHERYNHSFAMPTRTVDRILNYLFKSKCYNGSKGWDKAVFWIKIV